MNNTDEKNIAISQDVNYGFMLKIKHFFKNLFSKTKLLPSATDEYDEKRAAFEAKYSLYSIDEIQSLYESGEIKEKDIPDNILEELTSLYVSQIIRLDEDSVKYNNSI